MSLGLAYWILMLLWLVGALYHGFAIAPGNYYLTGGSLLLFLLFLLLGWSVFGAPLR